MNWPFSTPHISPLYQELPYRYKNVRKISAFCRCNKDALAAFLPEEFELVGDICEIFVMEAPDAGPLGSYTESGVVIPMSFSGEIGAHVALEYVSSDDALASGRELWGYPKKIAEVPFTDTGNGTFHGSTIRRGETLIDMSFKPKQVSFEKPTMQPRFQVKTFAAADGRGWDFYQIIQNQLLDINVREQVPGEVELQLGGDDADPLTRLDVQSIVGAETVLMDFLLTTGTIVKDLGKGSRAG